MRRLSFLAALAASAAALLPAPAEACGGFFCAQLPMNQAGERIAFSLKDGMIEAHVQIQYSGQAEAFAWVVPLPAEPTVTLGSTAFFSYLQAISQPRFILDWEGGSCGPLFARGGVAAPDADARGGEGPGVRVVSREAVGPYDTAILSATNATDLKNWLLDNQYDLTAIGEELLELYVGRGYFFVALRLLTDKSVGDLRPVVLRFPSEMPCVPIRLTAVAADPDMPITAWVFAGSRAVPTNYRHVLINEARIDWLRGGSNYPQLATAAVDEAGGRAFLTEYAGSVRALVDAWWGGRLDPGSLNPAALARLNDPVDFVLEVRRQNWPRDDLISLLSRHVPLPKSLEGNVTEAQFLNFIEGYSEAIAADRDRPPFDPAAAAHDLEVELLRPLRHAQAILDDRPYLTRLYTTMSAAEMTEDPEFLFNSGLGDVSNVYRASARCAGPFGDDITVTLANGRLVRTSFGEGPFSGGPAAERIEQLAATGPAVVVQDNRRAIDAALGCQCGSAGPASLGLLALLPFLRRRRLRGR